MPFISFRNSTDSEEKTSLDVTISARKNERGQTDKVVLKCRFLNVTTRNETCQSFAVTLASSLRVSSLTLRSKSRGGKFIYFHYAFAKRHLSELYNLFLLIFHIQSSSLSEKRFFPESFGCYSQCISSRLISAFCCFRSSFVCSKASVFYNNRKVSSAGAKEGSFD